MRGPGEGRLRSETKPLFCSRIGAKACAELTSHSNASDWNVQECLIWLAPRLKGCWGRKRRAGEEKRRLGRHCIIPAAINSLRSEAEWTHQSDRPQAEWHRALSHPSAPPWHGSRFKQVDKATGVYWERPLAMFDLQISWLRLTLRVDQLLFLKTFFSLSRLHIFVFYPNFSYCPASSCYFCPCSCCCRFIFLPWLPGGPRLSPWQPVQC